MFTFTVQYKTAISSNGREETVVVVTRQNLSPETSRPLFWGFLI